MTGNLGDENNPYPSYPEGYHQNQQNFGYQFAASGYASPQGNVKPTEESFFRALFDFSFSNFITLGFAKFIYVLSVILGGVVWLFFIFSAFSQSFMFGLVTLVFSTVLFLLYLVYIRLIIEFMVATVRTAQNTTILVEQGRGMR